MQIIFNYSIFLSLRTKNESSKTKDFLTQQFDVVDHQKDDVVE